MSQTLRNHLLRCIIKLNLSFHGIQFLIHSENQNLINHLIHDFGFFRVSDLDISKKVNEIYCIEGDNFSKTELNYGRNVVYSHCVKLITPEVTQWRYSTVLIHKDDSSIYKILFNDLAKSHERIYLLIQSIVTKQLDLIGYHRLHACGVKYKGVNLFLPLSMGQGKTTHFLEFIKDSTVEIFSDDSPLFMNGKPIPMPFRIGLSSDCIFHRETVNSSTIIRQKYGEKKLIPITDISNLIADSSGKNIFMFGGRDGNKFRCRPLNKIKAFMYLLFHMGVGVGLPMVREIYLSHGLMDLIEIPRVFTSRIYGILKILTTGLFYEVSLSHDPSENTRAIKKIMLQSS